MSDPTPKSAIRYAPTDGLTYNPHDPAYWDRRAPDAEVHRTFDLCNSCRLCFRFCQSFPTLFEAVDEAGDVRDLPAAKVDQVIDECFQCKLCYTNCPYTDAEGHEFRIDFPRLIMRANAIRRKADGLPLRERLLADPDRIGRLGTMAPALANRGNALKAGRVLMEKTVGIHREKRLPMFADQTFTDWIAAETGGRGEAEGTADPVVLMPTCYVTWNKPAIGQAAWRVLRHNACTVACPTLRCCGMPALDGGDVPAAIRQARENVTTLLPYVDRGYRVGVVNPTCSLMLKQEYPDLLDDPADPAMAGAARRVAGATRDLGEFLHELRIAGRFKEDFRSTPAGPVACHAPCHLRKQNVGFRGRDLIRRIPQAKPTLVAECCGHDGTWAMKTENFNFAMKNGRKSFDGMEEASAEVWATECPLAALQFGQACGRDVLHPVEILDRAYRDDGFATRIGETEPDAD